jgi:hypothetical protein
LSKNIGQQAAVLKTPAGADEARRGRGGGDGAAASERRTFRFSDFSRASAFRVVSSASLWLEARVSPAACRLPQRLREQPRGAGSEIPSEDAPAGVSQPDYPLAIAATVPMDSRSLRRAEEDPAEHGLVVCTRDQKTVFAWCPGTGAGRDAEAQRSRGGDVPGDARVRGALARVERVVRQVKTLEGCGSESVHYLDSPSLAQLEAEAASDPGGPAAGLLRAVVGSEG